LKRVPTEWEKIFSSYILIKGLKNFVKGRSPNGQKTHEEMLNISGCKGNANQNHIEVLSHSCENGYHQGHKQQQTLVRIQGKWSLHRWLVGM
jgi:hypothetical protein